jgi:hypothetical protein
MTARRFSAPDWGQDHLSLDAVVAFVDDELSAGAHLRAEAHLDCCRECRAEVVAQRQARTALRAADGPCLPSSLLRALRSIPVEAELPPPPPGLGITADGQFVLLRDVPQAPAHDLAPGPRSHAAPRRFSRRARVTALSGLALGALAVGALAAPAPPVPVGQVPVDPGVLGGAVLNLPAQARLSVPPAVPAVLPAAVPPSTSSATPTAPPGAGPAELEPTAPAVDRDDVLDAALRARLDGAPIAFHRSP